MRLQQLLFHRFRTIGRLGRLLVATCCVAAFNFGEIFVRTMKAASAAGTYRLGGEYELTVCYFGPPLCFYPKFLIACSLLIVTVAVFRQSFPRSVMAVTGLVVALTAYSYWWIASYRAFRNFGDAGISFINNPEIKQAAYLYQGTWLDAGVAASVVVCSVLLLGKITNRSELVD